MKKVKVYCLNCYKKNEVETGVECTCPKCGSTFSLKEEATSDRANKLKDKIIYDAIINEPKNICELYDKIEIREAFKSVINLSTIGNVYLEQTAPWSLIKNGDRKGAAKVLYLCLNLARALAMLAFPVLPFKMKEVYSQLNFAEEIDTEGNLLSLGKINVGKNHKVNAPSPLFRRIDDEYLDSLKAEFSEPFDIKSAIEE